MQRHRFRFWFEILSAVTTCALTVLTLASREWMEVVLNQNADQHDGSIEWLTVLISASICLSSVILSGHEWRRSHLAAR